ncbi:uncharacterized protein CCR75_006054 [Bremia lactucae]|uniref:Uncharacterized protein n=1 Tax=Bremia lactucae TaxID=4779 RepID=A0A976FDY0_BRELC|nr:hypothetical protein CCR75_006054 [Bremia lactucae]
MFARKTFKALRSSFVPSNRGFAVLTTDTINPNILKAAYAVRGALVLRSIEYEKRLARGDRSLPFDKIIPCNIGNPQVLEQEPIEFHRQVLALVNVPGLVDQPEAQNLFPPDAIARAKFYISNIAGGTGAYGHSKGSAIVREEVARFLQRRDGHAADTEDIYLTDGASPAVQNSLQMLILYQENVYAQGKRFFSFKKVLRDMGKEYDNVELISFHSTSKGFTGECGRRGGYMELVNIHESVKDQFYKLMSVNLCSNIEGQLMVGMMTNPPQPGDASYKRYREQRDGTLQSLKRRAMKLVEAFNKLEGVTCNETEALQRALAETPRLLPQKKRRRAGSSAMQSAASPLKSPVSLMRPKSSRKSSEMKRTSYRAQEMKSDGYRRQNFGQKNILGTQSSMAISDLRTTTSHSGFSFYDVDEDKKLDAKRAEKKKVKPKLHTHLAAEKESPVFAERKPIRLVKDVDGGEYSEAVTSYKAFIEARRINTGSALPSSALHFFPGTNTKASVMNCESLVVSSFSEESKRTPKMPQLAQTQNEQKTDEGIKEIEVSEQRGPLSDFQAFCTSFVQGNSTAELQAMKHSELSDGDVSASQQSFKKYKRSQDIKKSVEHFRRVGKTLEFQSLDNCSHDDVSETDEQKISDIMATQLFLEKRTYDQAFGSFNDMNRPEEKTPRITRRISFSDEVEALAASSPEKGDGEHLVKKCKHVRAFGMPDEEDEEAEWRESLAFQSHLADW